MATPMPLILALLLTAGGFALIAGMLIGRNDGRAIARRVSQIGGALAAPEERAKALPGARQLGAAGTRLRALFTLYMSRSWGVTASPYLLMLAGLVGAALGGSIARYAIHVPSYLAFLIALAGFFGLPRLIVVRQQLKVDAVFAERLPDAIDMVVRMVRAGIAVAAAIRSVGSEAGPPVSTVFVQIADLAEIGMPLEAALAKTAEDVGNADFRFFAVAVALQRATGGNLAVSLETLSEIIRKRRAVRLKAIAATAEIRISAIVLSCIPFFVVGALLVMSPQYLRPLITDPRGNVIGGLAILSLALGGLTMRWMIRSGTRT